MTMPVANSPSALSVSTTAKLLMLLSACLYTISAAPLGLCSSAIAADAAEAKAAAPTLNLVPWPKSVQTASGTMPLKVGARIAVGDAKLLPLAEVLAQEINQAAGVACKPEMGMAKSGDISLDFDTKLHDEQYTLTIKSDTALVRGGTYGAIAIGTVTLLQAMTKTDTAVTLPNLTVTDQPQVAYRGIMLDLARQPHTIAQIKQIVQLSRLYKIRYLQLHLSDDPAFCFPSTKYADKLKGSWKLVEVKELVKFADDRGVTIVPELDVPGHATALVQAMPDVFGKSGNVVDAGREGTYAALDTLVGEISDVFGSSPYFHIGGDEVNKGCWNNPDTAAYMTAKKIENVEELYRHFIVRVNEIVKKHGKKTIVWEGFANKGKIEIPKDITVMAYEIVFYLPHELVKDGYNVINATWTPLYVVNANCRPPEEIYAWNLFRFKKFNAPAADAGLNVPPTPQVLGAQMCAWEQPGAAELPSLRKRLPAMSERIYSPDAGKNFKDFDARLTVTDKLLDLILAK
ncbi:MAG: family 20 glycosylhydrolase [Planctomycetota bacterium]|nr:family 20 glycosylhydrolase [Planctomycetota bacterium]